MTLTPRDRNLLVYVLWPAALLACLIWIVGPLTGALAATRGAVEQRQSELAAMRLALARAGGIADVLQRLRAQHAALRQNVISPRQSVSAVVSLQQLLRQSGNTVLTVRVGEMERPRRAGTGPSPALARIAVEVTAHGSYASLSRFLRQWPVAAVPLKLSKVEASRNEGGGLDIGILASAFVPAPPDKENP